MKLIDTHSHLYHNKFDRDQAAVIARAQEVLNAVVLPNIDLKSIPAMLALTNLAPDFFFPAMGLHPCDVTEDFENALQEMKALIEAGDQSYYAIGETGLDRYWDKSDEALRLQQEALKVQVQWAKEYQLPIILHTRNATDETIQLIQAHHNAALRGIFHCFDGSLKQAEQILELGSFKLGIGGILTYRKDVQEVVKALPLSAIVLETDSPYLPPEPHRKDKPRRNESSYTKYVGTKLAELHGISYEEVAEQTNLNASEIFHSATFAH